MNKVLKNTLALIGGLLIGMMVNMGIIILSGKLIAPPAGVNPQDFESIKANIHLYEPIQFLFPFLAHAIGTFAGAFVAANFSANRHFYFAMFIGIFFLIGGITMVIELPNAPFWFNALDLVVAYVPMAFLGYRLARK